MNKYGCQDEANDPFKKNEPSFKRDETNDKASQRRCGFLFQNGSNVLQEAPRACEIC